MAEILAFASNLIALLIRAAAALRLDSSYAVRITMFTELPDAIYIRSIDRHGHPVPLEQLAAIPQFIPVDGAVDPTAGDEAVLDALRDIATDLVNQGGIAGIGSTHIRVSMPATG